MIRPRGGATRRRDDQQEQAIATIVEIGRRLRGAREERGLTLLAVHDRLSRPITQLEALESGDLARLPDQALAISTLRRYATFLGLDGDSLALKMIDAWSVSPYASMQAGAPVTSVVAAAVTTGPDHLRAFTQTGKVPKVGGRATSPTGTGPNGHEATTGPPTGTFPVVPRRELRHSRRAVARARRQLRAPRSLKVVTWVACLFVLAALVGLGIRQWHPQWLASSHILRVVQPGSQTTHPAVSPLIPSQPASATQTTHTTTPSAHHHQTNAVELALAGPTGEAYSVNTSHFTVNVATSGTCWVQITSSQSLAPLVSGVQPGGKSFSEPAKGTMTVQLGSSSVLVGIVVKGKTVFLASPHVVPVTYTFVPPS